MCNAFDDAIQQAANSAAAATPDPGVSRLAILSETVRREVSAPHTAADRIALFLAVVTAAADSFLRNVDSGAATVEQETRAILDTLDILLSTAEYHTAGNVIDVLAALRGPDNGSAVAKGGGTNFVRQAALPRVVASIEEGERTGRESITRWDVARSGELISTNAIVHGDEDGYSHFSHHVYAAAQSLGLERSADGRRPVAADDDADASWGGLGDGDYDGDHGC